MHEELCTRICMMALFVIVKICISIRSYQEKGACIPRNDVQTMECYGQAVKTKKIKIILSCIECNNNKLLTTFPNSVVSGELGKRETYM